MTVFEERAEFEVGDMVRLGDLVGADPLPTRLEKLIRNWLSLLTELHHREATEGAVEGTGRRLRRRFHEGQQLLQTEKVSHHCHPFNRH